MNDWSYYFIFIRHDGRNSFGSGVSLGVGVSFGVGLCVICGVGARVGSGIG